MQIPCWLRILIYFTQKDFCNLHKAVKKKEEYFGRILERNGQVCVPPKMGHEATKLRLPQHSFPLTSHWLYLHGYCLLPIYIFPTLKPKTFLSRSPNGNILGVTVIGQTWTASQSGSPRNWKKEQCTKGGAVLDRCKNRYSS